MIATLIETNLKRANLTGCNIFGISSWDVDLEETIQSDLNILFLRDQGATKITVDNLELAQFIYLLIDNKKMALHEIK